MTNILKDYDPTIYAQESLEQLEKALGMAFYVHRGYEAEARGKGSVISIKRPSSFTAQSMPIASAAGITAEQVQITLNQWDGVVFSLTDKELSATDEVIINDHIRPAALAIADSVDQKLAALYIYVPWFFDTSDPGAVTDFTGTKQIMFDNKVPLRDRALMINGEREADYSALQVFHSAEQGVDAALLQRDGVLGKKFGYVIFANQNVKTHVQGTAAAGDNLGAVNGAHAAGVTALAVNNFTGTETVKAGDCFTIAGHTQKYVITADLAFSAGAGTLTINPGLAAAVSGAEVVTIRIQSKLAENLAFYRGAFALGMAPLSDIGNNAGARMGIATDPNTQLALRSRLWYEGKEAAVYVGLDALFGVKSLDANMAVRMNS